MVFVIGNAIWSVGIILAMMEFLHRPARVMCACGTMQRLANPHLKAALLLLVAFSYISSGLLFTVAEHSIPELLIALLGVLYGLRWWWHTKQGRKKLKDKALGVIRQTVVGLKVVPVPQGGAS